MADLGAMLRSHGVPQLPKKHGRGGQSALRFARLRLEKRHNYVTKVAGERALLPLSEPPTPFARRLFDGVSDGASFLRRARGGDNGAQLQHCVLYQTFACFLCF